MLRLSLATRLALIVLVGFSAVITVSVAIFYVTSAREGELAHPSPGRLDALASLIEQMPPAARSSVLAAVTSSQFIARVESGVGTSSPLPLDRLHAAMQQSYAAGLGGRAVEIVTPPDRRSDQRFPRLARLMTNGTEFRIGLRTGETLVVDSYNRLPVTPLGLPVGFGAGLFGTIVALLALLVMHRETRPLAQLAAAVDRVDLSSNPPTLVEARRSAPEIRAVVAAFSRLQDRLNEMLRARMTLIGGIAHDVRTFATRLRLRVEHIADSEERNRAITDIDDMIRLLDDALLSARAGAGGLAQEMVEFAALVQAEVGDRQAQGEVVDVVMEAGALGVIVLGDRLALRRIIGNVVDNAIKYGHAAHLRVALRQQFAVVSVDDEGPGIPAEARQAMFEPFNRLETSRNRATGGAGLGLAVVRALVEAHGGTVDLSQAPGGGTRVNISLPTFNAA